MKVAAGGEGGEGGVGGGGGERKEPFICTSPVWQKAVICGDSGARWRRAAGRQSSLSAAARHQRETY